MSKKAFTAASIILICLFSVVAGFQIIHVANANPHVFFPDTPNMTLPIVTVQTPVENGSYPKGDLTLDFNVTKPDGSWFWGGYGIPPSSSIQSIGYYLDGKYASLFFNSEITDGLNATNRFTVNLDNLTSGLHEVGIEVSALHFYGGATSTPQSRQNTAEVIIAFNVDNYPPSISDLSVENKTYLTSTLPLSFHVNEPAWIGYSLDDQANQTVAGNFTLLNLVNGTHIIIVYANNTLGTWCRSEAVLFTVAAPLPSPSPTQELTLEPTQTPIPTLDGNQAGDFTLPIFLTAVAFAVVVAVVALVYFKRRQG